MISGAIERQKFADFHADLLIGDIRQIRDAPRTRSEPSIDPRTSDDLAVMREERGGAARASDHERSATGNLQRLPRDERRIVGAQIEHCLHDVVHLSEAVHELALVTELVDHRLR
jgi:hypothetical protein